MKFNALQAYFLLKVCLVISLFHISGQILAQDCHAIQYTSSNNQLSIANLAPPIEIIDVFDANWQQVFQCQGTDCGEELTIPNLKSGLYFVNIKLYTADWKLICQTIKEIEVTDADSSPIEILEDCSQIFEGDVTLSTQAEVDIFATQGYCAVTGTLIIGTIGNGAATGITDLEGLKKLISVGNDFVILNNPFLTSLGGLNNMVSVGNVLTVTNNDQLNSLDGLDNIETVGGALLIQHNDQISSLVGLKGIRSIGGTFGIVANTSLTSLIGLGNANSITIGADLFIQSNAMLIDLHGLAGIESIGTDIDIVDNSALTSLEGLNNIIKVDRLRILANSSLRTLDGLKNLVTVSEDLEIGGNLALSSCCAIQPLIANGGVGGSINISSNQTNCDSESEIREACVIEPNGNCNNVEVVGTSGNFFEISNIPIGAKIEYLGRETEYATQFLCEGNCGPTQTVSNLKEGEYTIKVQTFKPYCYAEYKVNVEDDSGLQCIIQEGDMDGDGICNNQDNCPTTANPAQVDNNENGVGDVCEINASQLICPENIIIKTNDPNGIVVNWEEPTIIASTICNTGGLQQRQGPNNGSKFPVGETEIVYTIFDNGSPSFCQNFTACSFNVIVEFTNEEESNNTVVCGEISITKNNNTITMKGQAGNNYFFKVHDLQNKWTEIFSCAYACGNSQTTTDLSEGHYMIKAYNEYWELICEQDIKIDEASSRNAHTKFETFTLYPNPAQEIVNIELGKFIGLEGQITIHNLYGQTVYQKQLGAISDSYLSIPLTDLTNGIYIVNIKINNRRRVSKRILVNRLY